MAGFVSVRMNSTSAGIIILLYMKTLMKVENSVPARGRLTEKAFNNEEITKIRSDRLEVTTYLTTLLFSLKIVNGICVSLDEKQFR